jgi:hypothetical protein
MDLVSCSSPIADGRSSRFGQSPHPDMDAATRRECCPGTRNERLHGWRGWPASRQSLWASASEAVELSAPHARERRSCARRAFGQIRFTSELASPSKRRYRSPGVAFGPAIAIALIYAGRASTRLTYETTFCRSSIVRPPNRGNEVSGNITITSAQVKSGPAK